MFKKFWTTCPRQTNTLTAGHKTKWSSLPIEDTLKSRLLTQAAFFVDPETEAIGSVWPIALILIDSVAGSLTLSPTILN